MIYRITGWHHGLPPNVVREVRAFLRTHDGTVMTATDNFAWAVGKEIITVLAWCESKGLRWAVAETREQLDKKRGRTLRKGL